MRGFTARLLATTAIPTIVAINLPNAAWATCAPDPAGANNVTVTCDAATEDTDGFNSGAFTGLTVNIDNGGIVTNSTAAPAISLSDGTVNAGQGSQIGGNTAGVPAAANTDGINIAGVGNVTIQTGGTVTGVAGSGINIGGAGNVSVQAGSTITGLNGAGIGIVGDGTVNILGGATITGTNAAAINVGGVGSLSIGTATLSSTNANGIGVASGTINSDANITVTGDNTVLAPIAGIRNPNGNVTTTSGAGTIDVTLSSNPFGSRRDIYTGYTGGPAAIGIFGGTGSNTTVNGINNSNAVNVTATGNDNVAIGLEGSGDTRLQNFGQITVSETGTGGIAIGMNASTDGMLNATGAQIQVTLNQGSLPGGQVAPNANQGANGTAIGMRIFNAPGVTPPVAINDNSGTIGVTLNGNNALGAGIAIDSSSANFTNAQAITVTDAGLNNTLFGIRGTPVTGTNNLTITNSTTGTITLNAASGSSATGISVGGAASAVNDGNIAINALATTSSAIGVDLTSSGTFTNSSTGSIQITGGSTVIGARVNSTIAQQAFVNDGSVQVSGTNAIGVDIGLGTAINNGQIDATGGIGVRINPLLGATQGPIFTNSATGSINATGTALLTLNTSGFGSPVLDNAGSISSSNNNLTAGAVVIAHGDSIVNQATGSITATGTGSNAIVIGGTTQPAATSIVSNAGTISAGLNAIVGTANAEQVDNTGTATITGNLSLGGGNDIISNAAGASINGNVDVGDGNNSVTSDGTISGDVIAGAGNDTLANTGTIGGGGTGNVTLGDGTNTLTNLGVSSTIAGVVTLGSGNDTVTNEGTINGNMTFGGGTNTLNNSTASASIGGNVTFGAGNDTVTNLGNITGIVSLGNGANTFTNSGTTGADVTGGTGNDTITNTGTIGGNIILTGGNNTLMNNSNAAVIGGNVTFGAGDDAVTNVGQIQGNVDGGGGTNTFTVLDGSIVNGNVTNFSNVVFQDGGTAQFNGTTSFQTTTINNAVNLITNLSVATMSIAPTGTLSGGAAITGNVINAGVLSPGDSTVGGAANTMTITGNYTQSSTGRMVIDFQGGNSDVINISGTATVAGELDFNVILSASPIPVGSTYTVLTAAGGINGAFSSINTSSTKFFTISYLQSATDIQVTLNRSSFVLPAFNSNQRAVAQALNVLTTASVGTASQVVQTLTFTEKTQAAPVIDQLIPEAALNLATPALVTRRAFLGAIADNARASGPNDEREGHWWSWASGFGQVADISGGSGDKSYGFSTGGIVTGASYGLSDTSAMGFVVGASTSDINVSLQPGNNRHRSVDGALYGAYIDGPVSATATASFGYDRFLTDRSINTGFAAVQASGKIGGYTTAGRLEGAYALDMGEFTLSPYVAAQVMNFHHGAYDETGAGTIGLRIAAENVTSIRSTLGLAAEKSVDLGSAGEVTLHLGAAWEREFGDRILSSKAAFLAAPSQSFTITGITQDKDTANVVGGLTAALTGNVNVSLRYEGNLGATETVNRGRADLTWRW